MRTQRTIILSVIMMDDRGRLVDNCAASQQHCAKRRCVLASTGYCPGPQRAVKAANTLENVTPEGHVTARTERREWVQRTLAARCLGGKYRASETAAPAHAAILLKPS